MLPYLAFYVGAKTLAGALQLLSLPGLTLGSIVFGGIHSGAPGQVNLYLGLSLLISALIWMWPITMVLKFTTKVWSSRSAEVSKAE